jgi:D-psicose/D-tagatose/L-ribulose 3-epimerase
MLYGAHSYLFAARWSDAHLDILDQAADLGVDCFEIGIGDDVVFDAQATRKRAESVGLKLNVSPGGLWPAHCDLSSEDPEHRTAGLDWHKKQVDLAHELGALAYCGSLYGHTGVVKRRRPPPDELPRTAEGLHALAEHAQTRGVVVALEPMSHFRTHLVNTPAQAVKLLDVADHPQLKLLLDTYHLITEVRDLGEAVRTAGDYLWGIHACENDRGVPGGGLVPWDDLFAALTATRFDGFVLLEAYNSSLDDFAYERAMFHNVCPDPAAFVTRGLAFLKDGLGKAAAAPQ